MKFYTYLYLRANGTPYYVGKGHGRRAFSTNRLMHRPASDARIYIQYWADESEAFEMEKYYIRLFGRKDNGTGILRNLTDGGEGTAGAVASQETREKMSAARKANPAFIEHCRRLSEAHRGKKLSPEHRRKVGEGQKGRRHSVETRRKMSEANAERCRKMAEARKGQHFSEEHRRKISEAHKANPVEMERSRKLAASRKGVAHTAETRRKISEARKANPALIEQSREWCRKLGKAGKGVRRNEQYCRKISERQKGRRLSVETRRKISEALKRRSERARQADQSTPQQLVLFP